jgi:hypothetical protein
MFSRLQRFGLLRYKPVSDPVTSVTSVSVASELRLAGGQGRKIRRLQWFCALSKVQQSRKAGVLHSWCMLMCLLQCEVHFASVCNLVPVRTRFFCCVQRSSGGQRGQPWQLTFLSRGNRSHVCWKQWLSRLAVLKTFSRWGTRTNILWTSSKQMEGAFCSPTPKGMQLAKH